MKLITLRSQKIFCLTSSQCNCDDRPRLSIRIRPFSISDKSFGHNTNLYNGISLCHQWHGWTNAPDSENNWVHWLPLVLFGIRAAIKDDICFSATEMVYGSTLRLPGEFILHQGHHFLRIGSANSRFFRNRKLLSDEVARRVIYKRDCIN